eukprot:6714703-Pyramimonas_sp.AAC.1
MEALIWQTGVKDDGALLAMAAPMTEALQEEQIRAPAHAPRQAVGVPGVGKARPQLRLVGRWPSAT